MMSSAPAPEDTPPPVPPEPELGAPQQALVAPVAGPQEWRAPQRPDDRLHRLATWPAPLVAELHALVARFPDPLRDDVLDLLVLGHLSPDLDAFVETTPDFGDLIFQGTRLHGLATLGVALGPLQPRVSRAFPVPALRSQILEREPRCCATTLLHALRRMARSWTRTRG